MRTSVQAMVLITESDAEDRPARRDRRRSATARSPARSREMVDAMGRYAELGFDEFIVPDFNFGATSSNAARGTRADRRRDRPRPHHRLTGATG